MVEVTFKCENIADLKLQIQEYSLAHLGLDFKAMAGSLAPKPKIAQPGESKERVMSNGTTRLHNPNYPGKMPQAAELQPKKKAGRPVGWRKIQPVVTEVAKDVILPPQPDPSLVATGPTKDEAKAALVCLNNAKGMPAALKALEKFNVGHLNGLKQDDYAFFIKFCKELEDGSL